MANLDFKEIIASDITLSDGNEVSTDAFSVYKTNGRTLIRCYYNDDDDTLTATKTIIMRINDSDDNEIGRHTFTAPTGDTACVKGVLFNSFILTPDIEDEGSIKVSIESDSTSGITGKDVQVQVSMIL